MYLKVNIENGNNVFVIEQKVSFLDKLWKVQLLGS